MNKKIYFLYFPDRLLSLLAKVLRKENEISRLKNSLQIDISKAKKILDWKPNYNINVAIKETILSYKKNLVE
jgi:nucleoside-diphosphate-sugar epimerase